MKENIELQPLKPIDYGMDDFIPKDDSEDPKETDAKKIILVLK